MEHQQATIVGQVLTQKLEPRIKATVKTKKKRTSSKVSPKQEKPTKSKLRANEMTDEQVQKYRYEVDFWDW